MFCVPYATQSYPSLTNHLLRYPAPEFKVCAWSMQTNVVAAAAAVGEISKYAKEWNIFEHVQSILQGIFFTGFAQKVLSMELVPPKNSAISSVLAEPVPYLELFLGETSKKHPVLAGLAVF